MGKVKFVCGECGYVVTKWIGRCPSCGVWNSFKEFDADEDLFKDKNSALDVISLNDVEVGFNERYNTNIDELDVLFGGGIVKGSISLIGGSPGIGKSTLLLQICGSLVKSGKVLYISGEESASQIKLRSDRLNIADEKLFILSESDMEKISCTIVKEQPKFAVIDSIQTVSLKNIASLPGSVNQVRECTYVLQKIAKKNNISIVVVGHVNKEGIIAGPKVLEHIVDTVLYFEGDFKNSFRTLRVVKNRFGSVNDIAVFDMKADGLIPVKNPSAMLLEGRPKKATGSCVCAITKGRSPFFAEVQSLLIKSSFGIPRRMCKGLDYNKLMLILAVLEKRAGYFFQNLDCYVNVVGGFKLDNPDADLAVALSIVASLKDVEIDENMLVLGEIGLAGEVRGVSGVEKTVLEAEKLGFNKVIFPYSCLKNLVELKIKTAKLMPVKTLRSAIDIIFGSYKKGDI